jgi:hypothetical protein
MLGHSSIITTADTYISVLPETAHRAAQATADMVIKAASAVPIQARRDDCDSHPGRRHHLRLLPDVSSRSSMGCHATVPNRNARARRQQAGRPRVTPARDLSPPPTLLLALLLGPVEAWRWHRA